MSRLLRALTVGALLTALLAVQAGYVRADNPSPSPSPCASPSPSTASGARTCDPAQSEIDQLKQRLGGDLARALSIQQQLSASIDQASASEQLLSDELTVEENRIADLQDQIAQLDQQISDLETRIAAEKEQIATLARAMYRRPGSLLDIIASSGNLSDALVQTTDMLIAGARAHALQDRLQSDLTKVQADRAARQSDLDQENAALNEVQAGLDQLSGIQARLDGLTNQMEALIGGIQSAAAQLQDVPPDVSAALAGELEQQQATLAAAAQAAAWAAANAGGGIAAVMAELPAVTAPSGITFSWPMVAGTITQPFGPTSFALEPPLGPYAHFHTGIDVAATLGTPVLSAADGMVIAVAHTAVGYGNYVIVAHGAGVMTLYGHLLATDVTVGQHVSRGQVIGAEGSTGFSTGPHLHFEIRIGGVVTDPMRFLPPR